MMYSLGSKDGTVYGPSAEAPVNAGAYSVTAVFTMRDRYAQLNAMTATLTILPAEPTYTAPPQRI